MTKTTQMKIYFHKLHRAMNYNIAKHYIYKGES